eukprot:SAG31_NODE_4126_length_3560_cov_2.073678_1_plen_84_part_10
MLTAGSCICATDAQTFVAPETLVSNRMECPTAAPMRGQPISFEMELFNCLIEKEKRGRKKRRKKKKKKRRRKKEEEKGGGGGGG